MVGLSRTNGLRTGLGLTIGACRLISGSTVGVWALAPTHPKKTMTRRPPIGRVQYAGDLSRPRRLLLVRRNRCRRRWVPGGYLALLLGLQALHPASQRLSWLARRP